VKRTFLLPSAASVLAVFSLGTAAAAGKAAEETPQVIILKLDDVTNHGGHGDSPVSPRWQRVTDFCEKSDVKASFGIIGFSLEQDDQAYFDWIRRLHRRGLIDFWNHGYRNRKATDKTGEFEGPFEQQKAALERTQKLAREKLGIELKAFGPHWSRTNADTARALEGIPEIRMWFYGPRDSSKFVFPRVLTLENPIFVPDPAKFRELYERVGRGRKCLALQGHPNAWGDKRWEGFVQIIDYLRSKGCVFMTPSQYMEEAARAAGTQTSMKGWELYIWPQEGETYFSLMAGTNRLKTDEEIAQAAVKGIDATKPKLNRLKAGQHVFVRGRRLSDRAPGDHAKAVAEYCAKIGLNVQP
jgi:peptidoglycan/xylan/chitin deacetylase (PgdA/CDA1 family)